MERHDARNELLQALDEALGHGHGTEIDSLEKISRSLLPTFTALPKNNLGRLEGRGVRYLVHGYFVKEYGWQLRGVDPHRNDTDQGGDAGWGDLLPVLREKAPLYVKRVLMKKQMLRGAEADGFALKDAVVLIALLKQLILQEGITTLAQAYEFNGYSYEDNLSEYDLDKILVSHLMLHLQGSGHNSIAAKSVDDHQRDLARIHDLWPDWEQREDLVRDLHRNAVFAQQNRCNPFKPVTFSFEETTKLMAKINEQAGQVHHGDCMHLKESLAEWDKNQTGRVTLGQFYLQQRVGYWHLVESPAYLRSLGTLDETATDSRLIIPNYVTSVTNCDATSRYYSVCCINECEGLMDQIEVDVRAPSASPRQILQLVSNLNSESVDAPRNLSMGLERALNSIAALHGGKVLLHGRLFAQWMHYAFPLECPYPHMSGRFRQLSSREYKNQGHSTHMANGDEITEEIDAYMNSALWHTNDKLKDRTADKDSNFVNPMTMWTLEEELWVAAPASISTNDEMLMGLIKSIQLVAAFITLVGFARTIICRGAARKVKGSFL